MEKGKVIHRRSFKDRVLGVWKRYAEVKHGLVGIVLVFIFFVMAFLAPVLYPNYPGQINSNARVGPNFAPPEWAREVTNPDSPPTGNYIPDPAFESDTNWQFSTTNASLANYEYDYDEFSVGERSVKLTLIDNDPNQSFVGNVNATTTFNYPYTKPTAIGVNVSFSVKARINGTIQPNFIHPYLVFHHDEESYKLGGTPGLIKTYFQKDLYPNFPTEFTTWDWNVFELIYDYTFTKGNNITLEFGLEFGRWIPIVGTLTQQDPSAMGSVEFWFDNIQIIISSPFYGLLGTTNRGEDVMAQLFWGTQVSLYVGLIATFIGVGVGLVVGLLSGYFGGLVDELLMRIVDFFLIIPTLPILLVLAAIFNPSIEVTTLIIAIFAWPGTSRIIRSQVLVEKEKAYVEASRAAGAGDVYLIFKHVLPNVLTLVFIQLATGVSGAIITESALAFLGLTPFGIVSWGRMLQASYSEGALNNGAWWFIIPPGAVIVALSMGFIFIGYATDKAMNPRHRRL
ncbi:MAG: ABC transporter permease [Candidatus Heimdallarchaeota archaeon]